MEKTDKLFSSLVEKITTHIRDKFDAAGVLFLIEFIKMKKVSDSFSLSENLTAGIKELISMKKEIPSKIYRTVSHYNPLTEKYFDRKSVSNLEERNQAVIFNENMKWKIKVLNEVLSLVKPEILQIEINQENKDDILSQYEKRYNEELKSIVKGKYTDAFYDCYDYNVTLIKDSKVAFEQTIELLRPYDRVTNYYSFSKQLKKHLDKKSNKKKMMKK